MIDYIVNGIMTAFTLPNLLAAFLGTFAGIIFGALPGFTPSMGIAVLIPFTYAMDTTSGLILLAAVYCGAFYGGSISAILVNTPGTPAAAATAIDGFKMTQQGRAKEALHEAVIASFWGGIISCLALLFLSPIIAQFSLKFGAAEKFMLAIFGLTIIATLSTGSVLKGLMGGVFGLTLALIGTDPIVGLPRFTFKIPELLTGVSLVPALIGLYSVPQIMTMVSSNKKSIVHREQVKEVGNQKLRLKDLVRYPIAYIRSALIGIVIGIIPGPGGNTASWLAYNQGKIFSKKPEAFGTGSREAIANTEAANNAVTGGSLIPMLTLGIPGNAIAAVLMGALMIKGLAPGPTLFQTKAGITYAFIIGIFIANLFMLLIGLAGAKHFSVVALVPSNILAACVAVLCVIGSYAVKQSFVDVIIMLIFGALGYFLKYFSFDSTPVVLGLILGSMAEQTLGQAKLIYKSYAGVGLALVTRPICIVLILICVASVVVPFLQEKARAKKNAAKKGE